VPVVGDVQFDSFFLFFFSFCAQGQTDPTRRALLDRAPRPVAPNMRIRDICNACQRRGRQDTIYLKLTRVQTTQENIFAAPPTPIYCLPRATPLVAFGAVGVAAARWRVVRASGLQASSISIRIRLTISRRCVGKDRRLLDFRANRAQVFLPA